MVNGTTRQTPSIKTVYVVACHACKDKQILQIINTTGSFDTTKTPMTATGIVDLALSCSTEQVPLPPSDNTTALAIICVMGTITVACIVAMIIFCFKRKPPPKPFQPKLPDKVKVSDNTFASSHKMTLKAEGEKPKIALNTMKIGEKSSNLEKKMGDNSPHIKNNVGENSSPLEIKVGEKPSSLEMRKPEGMEIALPGEMEKAKNVDQELGRSSYRKINDGVSPTQKLSKAKSLRKKQSKITGGN